ncbi:MAG: hypothetical protein QXL04_00005, partial [Metallosphaera sp.]
GEIDGYLDYQSSTKSATLGMSQKDYVFSFHVDERPAKGYLVIITESPADYIKWRLWLNNFSLTKEFKPNLNYLIDDTQLSFHIFDVTHLMVSGKNELTINYNGARPLTVRLANATLIVRSPGFYSKYSLMAGLQQLRPGDVVELSSMGKNYVIIRNISRGKVKVMNGKSVEDLIEVSHECEEIDTEAEGSIRIMNFSGQDKKTITQILLHYSYKASTPSLDFDAFPELTDDGVKIRLFNKGDVDIDKLTLNVMINGITAGFKTINRLGRGEGISCNISLPVRRGQILVRIVGMRAGLRKIVDKELTR